MRTVDLFQPVAKAPTSRFRIVDLSEAKPKPVAKPKKPKHTLEQRVEFKLKKYDNKIRKIRIRLEKPGFIKDNRHRSFYCNQIQRYEWKKRKLKENPESLLIPSKKSKPKPAFGGEWESKKK